MPLYSSEDKSRYSQASDLLRLTLVTGPASEPVTLTQAKSQLAIAAGDTSHNDQLDLLIQQAREQFEKDSGTAVMTQTWSQTFPRLQDQLKLTIYPVQSVTSIQYYDSANANQTLSTDIYSLDTSTREIRLDADQTWPDVYDRWDCVRVTYVAGYTSASAVPAAIKQAILLLVAYYFEDRDMLVPGGMQNFRAYERLLAKYQRSDYP